MDTYSSATTLATPGAWPSLRTLALRWTACALTLAVILVIPFFVIDVPPVLDYPNHLARYFVLAHPNDPFLSQIYHPQWRLLPNLGMDVLGAGLLKITSVHIGGRILLAVSLLAPPVGVAVYHRVAFGRLSYWPLASGLIAYNGIFFLGFMNFLLSLGLAFAGAACWMAQRRRGDQTAPIVGACAAVLIYFSHIFGLILFAVLIGAQELSRLLDEWRRNDFSAFAVLKIVGLLAFVLTPAILLYFAGPLAGDAAAPGAWLGDRKLWTIFTPVMTTSVQLTLLSGLLLICLIALCVRTAEQAPGTSFAMLVLGVLFVAAPTAIKGGSFVDVRMPLMMALLFFAGLQPRFGKREALVVCLAVVAMIVTRTAYISATWIEHREDLKDVRAAISPLPPLARVLVARPVPGTHFQIEDVASRVLPGMYRLEGHMPALIAIERRAFWPLMFADPSQQPLALQPRYEALAQPLAEPVIWSVLNQDHVSDRELAAARYLPDWRSKFDYVLLIEPPREAVVPHGLVPIASTNFAILYKIQTSPL